ncbi:serine/threonine protein kinase [Streptomyces sp. CEV 2-1]|uniref:serine/threonine-protein kinase n=1 Tax=Streptomyces sp. CEV 2-1 TaxID=2485153 RepID=UPI000FAD0083|nr:serine/threonine-protein kinase [Streptomyces sp. CEV 2-1]ROQ65214.1 serine/threonine protein kinase [Streptomyces sp. CEV 2-1]
MTALPHLPPAPPHPYTIGPYRVIRPLGSGGMGRVYLAATPGGRAVAVKVVRESYARDPRFRERFRAETEAAVKVSGAFTAPVLAADPDAEQPWMATAYLPAPSLEEAVTAHGPLPERTWHRLAAGLTEALAAIHAAGLVHRDLKPSNVLLTEDGPYVIDFGISRAVDRAGLTGADRLVGTAGYMPPEQLAGRTCTAAGDVFSLGATLVFAATGHGAFGDGPLQTVMYRAARGEPDLTGVPEKRRSALAACLAKDARERPALAKVAAMFGATALPSAGWLPESLTRELRDRQTSARDALRGGPGSQMRRRRMLVAAVGAGAALGVGGYLTYRGRPSQDPHPPRLLWQKPLPEGFTKVRQWAEGRLLVSDTKGAGIAALDPANGNSVWQSKPFGTAPTATDSHTTYAIEVDGALHARDAATGARRWRFAPPGNAQPTESDLAARASIDGWVYVTSKKSSELYALDEKGTLRWHQSAPLAAVYPYGGVLLCVAPAQSGTDFRSTVHAVNPHTGKTLWSYAPAIFGIGRKPSTELAIALRYDTAELTALRLTDGHPLWTVPTALDPSDRITDVTLAGEILLSDDGRTALFQQNSANGFFAAVDTTHGKALWRHRAASPQTLSLFDGTLLTTPVPSPGTAIAAGHGPLVAYSLRDGRERWRTPDLGKGLAQVLATRAGLVLLGIDGGSRPGLYCYALADGKQVWHLPYQAAETQAPSWAAVVSGDRLWVSSNSTLLAFALPTT